MIRSPLKLAVALLCAGAGLAQLTMFPVVRGTREMVAAANNFEVEAGYRMLMQGGNAVDAGVAAVLTAAVTEQARFGLGGEMPLIVKMKGKPPAVVNGVGIAPALATPEFYRARQAEQWENPGRLSPIPSMGIRAAITPGVFDGLLLALEKYGTMSYAQVSAPAIEYANGFPLGEEFARFIRNNLKVLALWPSSRETFLPGGEALAPGVIFRQPALSRTLQELAAVEKKARGNRASRIRAVRDYFHTGALAKRIAKYSEENGGLLRLDDLKKGRAVLDEPVTGDYRGYTIVKSGFWTQGPVMIQALNILEGFDLKSMGHNSAEYLHTVVEAVKLAFADRDRYYGDPSFAKIPAERLLSKEYAAERRRLIDPAKASLEHRPGDFAPFLDLSREKAGGTEVQDTTCVNVVDRHGNAFSATPSGAWLPSVIAGDTGIPFSTRLQSFVLIDGHPNLLAPGKRPRVTLTPTLVLRDGELYMAMSTPGGDNQDQALLQVLLNIIDFGMTPQEAVEAPRFQSEHFYSSFGFHEFNAGRLNVEKRVPAEAVEALKGKGHLVEVRGEWSNSSAPTVILVNGGALHGGADPRRGRFIMGR